MDQHAMDNSSSSSPVNSVGSTMVSLPACLSAFTPVTALSSSMWDFDENGNICPKGPQGLPVASGSGHLAQKRRSRFAVRDLRSRWPSRSQSLLQVRQEW